MRSHRTLRQWVQALLPTANASSQQAARRLLRALLLGFTVELGQLARHLDHPSGAKVARQYLCRWLDHPRWQPPVLYAQLARQTRRLLRRPRRVLLLIDTPCLADGWVVLQVSVPFQRRALPLYRSVYPYAGPARDQVQALQGALHWLSRHLPGPRSRYVLVLDRGFPSTHWVRYWQASGWRFVARIKGNWRVACPAFTGLIREAPVPEDAGPTPVCYQDALLGWRDPRERGPEWRGVAHVVRWHDPRRQEPWFLVTNLTSPWEAVQVYAERMRIEQEFRDLKGPWGLDHLATWTDAERVARLLAWLAVYEWRLACLWLFERLHEFEKELRVGGKLSWIRTVREWLARQVRLYGQLAIDPL
jgi:hypothetical protein